MTTPEPENTEEDPEATQEFDPVQDETKHRPFPYLPDWAILP
jgi:hypothetical protein